MSIYIAHSYYVYQYLREDGIPYYVGKGKGNRAFKPHSHIEVPAKSHIEFVQQNITEDAAFELERQLISEYGRVDTDTGPLLNRTSGGNGASGRVVSEEQRERFRGTNNPMYGKSQPDWVKERISAGAKKFNEHYWTDEQRKLHSEHFKGEKNGMYGKTHSVEVKEARRIAWTGGNNPNFGGVSDEHRKNISIAAQNRPRHICTHCGKEATAQNLKRWHNDNCKQKGA